MAEFFKPKKQVLKTPQQAYDELLGNSPENQVVEIDISLLDEIDDQPQGIHQDKIEHIAESMKVVGQIDPVTVVASPKKDGRFILLAGRHRKRACMKNGLTKVKAIIKQETNPDKQRLILLATNNDRNTDYLPSELAFSYAEQAELLKKLGNKSTVSAIAEQNQTDRKAVHRHIRLTHLIKPLLNRVDTGSITVVAGYELSFLSEQQQITLLNFLLNHSDCCSKLNKDIAREIRLSPDNLNEIFYPPVDVPALLENDDTSEKTALEKEPKAEKEKVFEPVEGQDKTENSPNKCPTVGHLKEKEIISMELGVSIAAIVLKYTSSILEYYITQFPLYYNVENMITERFNKFKAKGETSDMPYQEYNNCIFSLAFNKKLEIELKNKTYKISYKELDEYIRIYLRKYLSKEKLIEIINNA